jgi:SAM-dependent methyltransferase
LKSGLNRGVGFEEYDAWSSADYPPMSHPSADVAVNAAVARAAGLDAPQPAGSRILEIGCGEGHHLLSLANRWTGACCVGLDLSAKAIHRARSRAMRAGLGNALFCEARLSEFEPDAPYDFIIAHGFFSWVADEVKVGLMDFIGKNLTLNGTAVLSFNVAAGWKERMVVVEKARAIMAAGEVDAMEALAILRTVAGTDRELYLTDDMLAKGAAVLAHDDFAPIMDAWSLGAVVKLAEAHGLRWIGDSVSGARGDDSSDNAAGTTFRSELICRADAVFGEALEDDRRRPKTAVRVPNFPKLDAWRMLCAREALPLPDADMKSCVFTFPQLKVLIAMDGSRSVYELSRHAKEVAPDLDFVPWLRHVAERGLLG